MQRCPTCDQELPLEAFPPSYRGKPGNPCRKCHQRRVRAWKQANPRPTNTESNRGAHYKNRYGVSVEEVDKMLQRQHYRCLGCDADFNVVVPTVDHNHTTGVVRGMLCRRCNTGLGFLQENKLTLRRLMAYLDYDRTKLLVYVAGSLRNPTVPVVGQELRAADFDVLDEWHSAGEKADDAWQSYEQARGRTFVEALHSRAAENTFYFDRAYLDLSDAVVMVAPAGRSAHLELGYMCGRGKPTFILATDEPERYEVMPKFADGVFSDVSSVVAALKFHRSNLGLGVSV